MNIDPHKTVTYRVHFVGTLEVPVSMNSIKPIDRESIAYECIYRICRAANFISSSSKQKCPTHIAKLLGEPAMQLYTRDVDLVIGTEVVQVLGADGSDLTTAESTSDASALLFEHPLQLISFASPGVGLASDFMCYFGKDSREAGRRCLVFECVTQSSTYVLATFRTAFEQRVAALQQTPTGAGASSLAQDRRRQQTLSTVLESDSPPPPSPHLITFDSSNCSTPVATTNGAAATAAPGRTSSMDARQAVLAKELWFHGALDRSVAESLVTKEGDFLVRVSTRDATQYVLTGLQNGKPRHLLLVDEHGNITTKDRQFESISHLVQYHRDNNIPISSPESAILLRCPVLRKV